MPRVGERAAHRGVARERVPARRRGWRTPPARRARAASAAISSSPRPCRTIRRTPATPCARRARRSASSVDQLLADELHAPVGARQRVEDGAVEDEGAQHLARRCAARGRAPRCRRRAGRGETRQAPSRALSMARSVPKGQYGRRTTRARAARNKMAACLAASINLTHQFLIAMPGMARRDFRRSVIYLCEHSEQGALGLVINKPIDINLKNLFEKVELSLRPRRPGRGARCSSAARCRPSAASCCTSRARGQRRAASRLHLDHDDPGRPRDDHLQGRAGGLVHRRRPAQGAGLARLLGWGAGQLEDELADNSWLTVEADPASSSTRRSSSATTRRWRCSGIEAWTCSPRGGARMSARRCRPSPYAPPLQPFLAFDFGTQAHRRGRRQPAAAHARTPQATIAAEGDARFRGDRRADRRMAARRAGGRRALPPRRRGARQHRARAHVRAPAARPLRPAGVRGRRALQHDRSAARRRAPTPTRPRPASSWSSS